MSTVARIWSLARFRLGLYLSSGLMDSTLMYLLPLIPGLIVREFFNALTGQAQAGLDAWTLLALLVATAVASYGAGVLGGVIETSAQGVVAALLRTNALRSVLRAPGARALPSSSGEAISRLRNDVDYIVGFLTWTFDPVGQALVLVAALVVLSGIDPLITLAVVVPVVAVVTAVRVSSRRLQRYRRASQEAVGGVTGLLGDAFAGVVAIKAAGAEANLVSHLRELGEVRRRAAVRDQVFGQLVWSVATNAGDLGTGALLLVAASAMQTGKFTVGDFALVVSYLGILTRVTGGFGEFLAKLRQTEVSFDRLERLLPEGSADDLVRSGPVFPGDMKPARRVPVAGSGERFEQLDATDLCYQYPESGRGIDGVSLHLRRGSLTVVTGRVGAGKTTLLRALLGLVPLDAGEVAWNGRPIHDLAEFMVAPRSAYTPQVPRLFSETLRENILLGVPEADHVLERAVSLAALDRDLPNLDRGLDTLVGPRGARLSGGQIQRAAAARMLVRGAELLVVDDLSSALDVDTEQLLWDGLLAGPGLTILAVSHRRSLLRRADQVVVLKEGKLEDVGALGSLIERCEELRRIWHGVDSRAERH